MRNKNIKTKIDIKESAAVHMKSLLRHIYYFFRDDVKSTTAVTGVVMAGLILFVSLMNAVIPDREFSERENRMLAQKPEVSITAIKEGTFSSDMESYVTDQFVARDLWIRIRSAAEKFLGKYESNGVYKGDNGYLFEDITPADSDDIKSKIKAVNSFAARHPQSRTAVMLAPNAPNILSDYLPAYAPVHDQNIDIDRFYAGLDENIQTVDVRDDFRQSDEQIYYRTDHHWTAEGAKLAFEKLAPVMWLDPGKTKFDEFVLTDSFKGTLASKSGFSAKADNIKTYIPEEEYEYIVKYVREGKETASIYWPDNLKKNDKYTVFLGGNYAEVDIRTANPNRDKLLIVKDSYANSLVQFFTPYYGKIVMVDPRYYNGDLDALMRQEKFDQVLFMYNANTFFEDRSLTEVIPEQAE